MYSYDRFRRLTGRSEVAVSARDFKFHSPRHKFRRALSNIPGLTTLPTEDNSSTMTTAQGFRSPQNEHQTPSKHHVQLLSHQPQFHPMNQNHHQEVHQSQHATQFSQNHQCGPPSHMPEIAHAAQSPTIPQHMVYLQPLTGGHVGGRLHSMVRFLC
ncbi:C2H2 ZINC FINGER CGI-62-RELATED [Salix purpurea]|uniref:C2H2 ZINC FINGER CGI-62-RELATED n=1 Tax=Salix purpurea TaxID=77065 RepID=A0A9Q0U9V3_SALPP|nr:C2H2 ZINC FINGER CGI-62-RELATED [Salix purpurea]